MSMTNEIAIDEQGNCTVVGELAHVLWRDGGFPREKCCTNNFYVMEEGERYWEIRAAQSSRTGAMNYMSSQRVLVDVTNARLSYGTRLVKAFWASKLPA